MPQQPTTEQMIENFGLALTYALYQKTEPDDCYRELLRLTMERHGEKHNKEIEWTECDNKNCKTVFHILNNKLLPSLMLNPLSIQLMRNYALQLTPLGKTTNDGFIITLREKPKEHSHSVMPTIHPPEGELKTNDSGLKLKIG